MTVEADLLLKSYLKRPKLPTVATNYRRFAQEASQSNQPYERYLLALAEAEVHHREANSERKRIAQARFPVLKGLDSFDFAAIPSLNKQAVLELTQGNYIQGKENVVFAGPTGTGKTHCAIALGVAACRASLIAATSSSSKETPTASRRACAVRGARRDPASATRALEPGLPLLLRTLPGRSDRLPPPASFGGPRGQGRRSLHGSPRPLMARRSAP